MISKVIIKRAKKQREDRWSVKTIRRHLKYLNGIDTNRPEILQRTIDYWNDQLAIKLSQKKGS